MTKATFYQETTLKLCGRILNHNTVIPREFIFEYAKTAQREWNLSIAKRMQSKTIAAVGNIVNGITGENKIHIPGSEPVHQYHKYDIRKASYYLKDRFTSFDNMKFVLDYLTKTVKLLDSAVDDPNYNWRDANKAWSKAIKDVRYYNSTSTRLLQNKSSIGSMLIDFEIIFLNKIAFKKREMKRRMQATKEARKLNSGGQGRYKDSTHEEQNLTLGAQSIGFGQDIFYNAYNNYALYGDCHATYDTGGSCGGRNDSGGGSNRGSGRGRGGTDSSGGGGGGGGGDF
ncbi:unnamed protein product [Mucor circinelloides]